MRENGKTGVRWTVGVVLFGKWRTSGESSAGGGASLTSERLKEG